MAHPEFGFGPGPEQEGARERLIRERREQLAVEVAGVVQQYEDMLRGAEAARESVDADDEVVRIDYSGTVEIGKQLLGRIRDIKFPMDSTLRNDIRRFVGRTPRASELNEQALEIAKLEEVK